MLEGCKLSGTYSIEVITNLSHLFTVGFDHFHILRAIGKGAFGKVTSVIQCSYIIHFTSMKIGMTITAKNKCIGC